MEKKICELSDIIALLKNKQLTLEPTPLFQNNNFQRFRVCKHAGPQDWKYLPPLLIRDVELAYPVQPAYGECDPNTCRDISVRLTEELLEFGKLLKTFAYDMFKDDACTPMKEQYDSITFRLDKRGNRNLLTRIVSTTDMKEKNVRFRPGLMTDLFNVGGIPIRALFFRMEIIVTKSTATLQLVAENIYADFNVIKADENEQRDDLYIKYCM